MSKALFICGSIKQTIMMHQISKNLTGFECYFTPYYDDGIWGFIADKGLLESTILGKKFKRKVENYLIRNRLNIDSEKRNDDYDLVFTFSNLTTPINIQNDRVIMIKEEIIDSKGFKSQLANFLGVPMNNESTSATSENDSELNNSLHESSIRSSKIIAEKSLEHFYLSDPIWDYNTSLIEY